MQVYQNYETKVCVSLDGLVERNYKSLKVYKREGRADSYPLWDKWKKRARDMGGVTRAGGNGRSSLIEFEYLPPKYKNEIQEQFGEPKRTVASKSLLSRIQPDKKAAEFFLNYELEDGRKLPEGHIKKYTTHACLLNTIKEIEKDQTEARTALGGSMKNFWPKVSKAINNLRADYPHKLPKNPRALKRLYDGYTEIGYEKIIDGRWCNSNGEKITEEIEAWLIAEMAKGRQSIDMVIMKYPAIAKMQGWRTDITPSAFRERVSKPYVRQLIDLKRHGRKAFRKQYGHTFKLKKPQYSNDIWVSDGTAINWYYRNELGKPAMATTYMVMDSLSRKFLGWATKEGINKENFEMQLEAYRMAVRNSGAKPFQLLFDNQGGHKNSESRAFYSLLATKAFATQAYRPSGKPIERAFKDFQQLMLSEFPFWSGFGRESHSTLAFKPNMEAINKNIHLLPDYNELVELFDKVANEWNDLQFKGKKSPNQIYAESRNPEEEGITLEELAALFWNVQGPKKYHPQGINLRYKGQDFLYEVYNTNGDVDFDFRRKHLNKRFWIKYDPDQEFEDVELLKEHATGGYEVVATACRKKGPNRSIKYNSPEDEKWVNRQMNREQAMLDRMESEVEGMGYNEEEAWRSWEVKIGRKKPALAIAGDDNGQDAKSKLLNRM